MYIESIEDIILLEKFKKRNKLYTNIEEILKKFVGDNENKEIADLENMVRNAYRKGVIIYIGKYEKLIWEVIKDEKNRMYRDGRIFCN